MREQENSLSGVAEMFCRESMIQHDANRAIAWWVSFGDVRRQKGRKVFSKRQIITICSHPPACHAQQIPLGQIVLLIQNQIQGIFLVALAQGLHDRPDELLVSPHRQREQQRSPPRQPIQKQRHPQADSPEEPADFGPIFPEMGHAPPHELGLFPKYHGQLPFILDGVCGNFQLLSLKFRRPFSQMEWPVRNSLDFTGGKSSGPLLSQTHWELA